MTRILLTITFLLLASCLMAQEPVEPPVCPDCPEDQCKGEGNYWSDDLEACYLSADMDEDEILLFRQVNTWLAEKDFLNHEHNEHQAPAKAASVAAYNARIASLTSKRDDADSQEAADVFQAQIDLLTAQRDAYAGKQVNHGQAISDLSRKIGKTKEELDKLLTQ